MSRYKLPLKDSLVVGHVNPDGDSLSSVKAVVNYLRSNGCKAYAKIVGPVAEHLSWIITEDDLEEVPVEQTVVLDCGPTPDRIGFEIEGEVVSIDHHNSRIDEHKPRNKIYVLDRCSTAATLILDFGIIDKVLLVGLYTDTMFQKSWNELNDCFKKIEISDHQAEEILSSVRPTRYMNALLGIQSAKFHKCRNGFLIVETQEKDPLVVAEMMDTLFRYSENVCLVDGNGMGKLRTSNQKLKDSGELVKIATLFGGGGHNFAAGLDANNKKTTLFGIIKQLDVPQNNSPNLGEDGYEEV